MEKLTFVPMSQPTDRIVADLRRAMDAHRRKTYDTPATEQTKAITRRMLGEKDEA